VHCIARLRQCQGVGEIILVDASDESASLEILSDLQPAGDLQIEKAEQKGRGVQMNLGAAKANNAALLFLHCDSEIPHDAAAKIQATLQNHHWGRFDIQLDAPGWRFRLMETMMQLRSRLTNLATGDQGIFVRADWFATQGGFADIPLMEDIEFSKRVSAQSKPGLVADKIKTSARRWQKNGFWKTVFLMWKLRFLYSTGTSPKRLAKQYFHVR